MSPTPLPPGWANDSLSSFLQDASENAFHVFVHASEVFSIWRRINDAYRRALDHMNRATPWFPTLFFPRTHSSWLAAVRSATTGQLPETYMVLRGCLENAMYAFYLHDDPGLPGDVSRAETFLRRHDGIDWMKKVRKEFRPSEMLDLLETKNPRVGSVPRTVYDHAIDNGAHPNMHGLLSNMNMQDVKGGWEVMTEYMNADEIARGACWKFVAVGGICGLDIFALMWSKKFELLGLMDELDRLRLAVDRDPNIWRVSSQGPGQTR